MPTATLPVRDLGFANVVSRVSLPMLVLVFGDGRLSPG
jgi:hypothetical protein